jgi:hypothetical protein
MNSDDFWDILASPWTVKQKNNPYPIEHLFYLKQKENLNTAYRLYACYLSTVGRWIGAALNRNWFQQWIPTEGLVRRLEKLPKM